MIILKGRIMLKKKTSLWIIALVIAVLAGLSAPAIISFAGQSAAKGFGAFFLLSFVCIIGSSLAVLNITSQGVSALDNHISLVSSGQTAMGSPSGLEGDPGIGVLSRRLGDYFKKLDDKMKNVKGHASTIQCASGNMLSLSEQVLEKCHTTQGNVAALSQEGSQVSDNMISVSAAVEQASDNIDLVAAASEEMHSTITEIAKNMESARAVTGQAVEISGTVTTSMDKLGEAASQISQITETISEISEQTNLLALNATIESARAGEAGKGFAVVAGEIKSLAEQTSNATLKIRKMINGVSSLTLDSGKHITQITGIIETMSETVNTIAAALEQQSAATREISENAHQAATGMGEISSNVTSTAAGAKEMAGSIQGISQDSGDIGMRIFESKINTDEVKNISDILDASANELQSDDPVFDIGNVKLAHMGWRTNLEAVMADHKQMTPEDVVSHKDCAFGKWYFSEGKKFKDNPLYAEIGIHHEAVHAQAKTVIHNHNAGNAGGAEQEMAKFLAAKDNMFQNLDKLYLA